MDFSTIAAISTPHGKGGVAVLRVSGSHALEIVSRIFEPFNTNAVFGNEPRKQIYGRLRSADQQQELDDVLATYFPAPHSFTGEDTVEIACHGGEVITAMILEALLSSGAVMAAPGEFSRRSFINGKMSLSSAEGIADLLDAKTEESAILSSKHSRGSLSAEIERISEAILDCASSLWAFIDYPEDDLQEMSDIELSERLKGVIRLCDRLLESFKIGRAVNSGVSAVIVGRPNVGKSTFFNCVLGEEKAIVTSQAGTTRDVLEYPVKMGKVLVNLADTAGVRNETTDVIEQIGIDRALQYVSKAELVFAMFDGSEPFGSDDARVVDYLLQQKDVFIIPVVTKTDLPKVLDTGSIKVLGEAVYVSEKNPCLDTITRIVDEKYISDEAALREGRILTNARQKAALERAKSLLIEAEGQIMTHEKDVASLTLESALSAVLEIDGREAGEKILDCVFSRFCVGK